MKKNLLGWISIALVLPLHAQTPLDLDKAIESMKLNNTQLKVQQHDVRQSEEEYNGTLSAFLPRVSMNYVGFHTNDPLNAFGFKLQQGRITQMDFHPDLLNDPDGIGHFNTKFSLQQPILNFDIFPARKAIQAKIQAINYQKQFAQDMLEVEIKKSYNNLQYLYKAKEAVERGVIAYQEVLRNTENMEQQGYAKASDVLMVKVGLTDVQNRTNEINNHISNISNYLSWLMGVETENNYMPTIEMIQNVSIDVDPSFFEGRKDIMAMKGSITAQNNMTTMYKRALLPKINAFGEYNLYDKKAFGFGNNGYLVGASISWDIFNGNETYHKIKLNRIKVDKAEGEMQLYIEKNKLDLQKAKRDLITHQAKIDLAKMATVQANEVLRLLENRYQQGLEKTSDVLIAQAAIIERNVKYWEAVKDYNESIIQIDFLTK
ncbi:MAG: TolC family protein [Chitinophagales bacterium]|nr:TolC family protein [Chitinophagales bacterium]MCZ2394031.1 TolC family protein [Chitinophagales bacterium]